MNLKEIRIKKGLTQKQMAIKMAMEQTTYSRKENGKSPITEKEFEKLSNVLETSIEEIKKEVPNIVTNDNCVINDNAIGLQIISIPKDTLNIMLKYTAKLEEEVAYLKQIKLQHKNIAT
ncbi:helix-turn-helix domain-containing protein [Flavobacterium tiangeerense]|uniref:helix-turn-helix domain-containing protein n=1 Tax=Flavobacterium tiangeerense TaxID=459471 RepID=UPI0011AA53B6|nr:helix-turn-helix transcriptional regulator [Flavobacterium tiangeerense]